MMKSFGLTDKGNVRKDNQDCFIIERCESQSLYLAYLRQTDFPGEKASGL